MLVVVEVIVGVVVVTVIVMVVAAGAGMGVVVMVVVLARCVGGTSKVSSLDFQCLPTNVSRGNFDMPMSDPGCSKGCAAMWEPLEMSLWDDHIKVDASSKLQKSVKHKKVMELTTECTNGSPSKRLYGVVRCRC